MSDNAAYSAQFAYGFAIVAFIVGALSRMLRSACAPLPGDPPHAETKGWSFPSWFSYAIAMLCGVIGGLFLRSAKVLLPFWNALAPWLLGPAVCIALMLAGWWALHLFSEFVFWVVISWTGHKPEPPNAHLKIDQLKGR